MPPIEDSQNMASEAPAGAEMAEGDALATPVVLNTTDLASQGPSDETSPPTQESVPETAQALSPAPVIVKRNDVREYLRMALEALSGKKAKKLAKVMEVIDKRGSITNDQVEKLLHCSDATATRYLSVLEKDGKIIQTGKTGRAVTYRKV